MGFVSFDIELHCYTIYKGTYGVCILELLYTHL